MNSGNEAMGPFKEDITDLLELVGKSKVSQRPDAHERLEELSRHISHWNAVVNLVSRKDVNRLVSYHFCDSASLLGVLKPERDLRVLDVGGSNGLPGLVLAAISPYIRVTACDSQRKRVAFLTDACKDLGDSASYELGRADSKAFRNKYANAFDLIVARAVTKLRPLFKWCCPLLKAGGCIVAYKGSRCLEEVRQAESYFWSHGGRAIMVIASPWAEECNPLRLFAIASMGE